MAGQTGTLEKPTTAVGSAKPQTAIGRLKSALYAPSTQEQFQNVLKDQAGTFIASVLDVVSSDKYLQECEPNKVIMECMKAASLKLPINKNLGFAYVIAYKGVPQFQMGYLGIIQLAMRTGQFRYLNADVIYEGMSVEKDYLTGKTQIYGGATSEKVTGYFCYMELLNGFNKTIVMNRSEAEAHGKRFSKTFSNGPWQTDFDSMALKTVIKKMRKFMPLSVEMQQAFSSEDEDVVDAEIAQNANRGEIIEVQRADPHTGEITDQKKLDPGF
jgi:recombination protein RecT